ncbi:hypothetical protein V5O48_012558 [Marasmius crinis-equi]|uniref:F-box domain-containing protein n=1 Tax=Marasmius crinis-equi TaxID=585013 RepID=A0ABR3F2U5_9AGAR
MSFQSLPNEIISYIFLLGRIEKVDGSRTDVSDFHLGRVSDESVEDFGESSDLSGGEDGEVALNTDDDEDGQSDTGKDGEEDAQPGDEGDEKTESCLEERKQPGRGTESLPFPLVFSHVCRQWRHITLDHPSLWTSIDFFIHRSSTEYLEAYIRRSQIQPLSISMHGPISKCDEVLEPILDESLNPSTIEQIVSFLETVVPHAHRWRELRVFAGNARHYHPILHRLSNCKSAPLLEILQLDFERNYFGSDVLPNASPSSSSLVSPLFHSKVPKLRDLNISGVVLDWDVSVPLSTNLCRLRLAFHREEERPSLQSFAAIMAAFPQLESLDLCGSGPALDDPEEHSESGSSVSINLPSLSSLSFSVLDQSYLMSFFPLISGGISNLTTLSLVFDSEVDDVDFSEFAQLLSSPSPVTGHSVLRGLSELRIEMPLDCTAQRLFLDQLVNLSILRIKPDDAFDEDDAMWHQLLAETLDGAGAIKYCPRLTSIYTAGFSSSDVRMVAEARLRSGSPLKLMALWSEDELKPNDREWLETHVEELSFYERDIDA